MKSMLLNLLAITMLAGLVVSCGKTEQRPGDVVKEFTKKIEKGDLNVKNLLAKDLAAMFEDEKFTTGIEEQAAEMKEKGGVSGITIHEETIEGDNAKVAYTITYGNGETEDETAHLVKEDGLWKITISK